MEITEEIAKLENIKNELETLLNDLKEKSSNTIIINRHTDEIKRALFDDETENKPINNSHIQLTDKLLSFNNENEFNQYVSVIYGSDGWKYKSWTIFMNKIGKHGKKAIDVARDSGFNTSVFNYAHSTLILNKYVESIIEVINNKKQE